MTPKQIDMLKFIGVMVVVLLGVTVAFVVVLGIRLPWEAPPPPPTEPREFDLTSLKTMVRRFDPHRGMVAVKDLKSVEASGRCAVVADSMEQPTMAGYHFVFNAVDIPSGVVTAYPVQTEQLERLVQDCIAAGRAADEVATSTQDVLSEVKLAMLEAEKARAAKERANAPEEEDEKDNPITGVIDQVKDGKIGGVGGMLEGMIKK